jgi:hypothetical protein
VSLKNEEAVHGVVRIPGLPESGEIFHAIWTTFGTVITWE